MMESKGSLPSTHELQYRTEMTSGGRIDGLTGWQRYPHSHLPATAPVEVFLQEAELLSRVYKYVQVVRVEKIVEVVDRGE